METILSILIANFSFVIVISLIYFTKKRTALIINKLYKLYMIFVIVLSSFPILYELFIKNINHNIISSISNKLFLFTNELLITTLSLTIITIVKKIKVIEYSELLNYTKKIKYFIIILLVTNILITILPPYSLELLNNNIVMKNTFIIIEKIIHIIIYIFILIEIIRNNNLENKKMFKIIISTIVLGIILSIIQIFYYSCVFDIIYYTICLYIYYLIYTNPDIEVLNEIIAAQKDIDTSTKTKTEFLSNINSKIKNPLEQITNSCNSLIHLENFEEEEAKREIRNIVSSGNSLVDIVSNIVNMSKVESGKYKVDENIYKVKELIDKLKNNALDKLNGKKVEFILKVDENISSELVGDITKITIALTNILINAINYTSVGKITLTIDGKRDSDFETLLFKISDTGEGIKPEEQSKIFKKGVKFNNSFNEETDGTGLGLILAKEQIDAIGGKIWFTSEYGAGTTFYIEIKQKISNRESIKNVKENIDDNNKLIDCSNYKMLIVDDNMPNIKVIKRLVERYNFQTEFANSGKECIDRIKNEEKYDIIFLDHFMPELDGIETIKVLKSLTEYKLPPIICVTANSLSGMKEVYLKEGFDDFIAKPIKIDELDKVIKKYFK